MKRPFRPITDDNLLEVLERDDVVAKILEVLTEHRNLNAARDTFIVWASRVDQGFELSQRWWSTPEVIAELRKRQTADWDDGGDRYGEFLDANGSGCSAKLKAPFEDLWYVINNRSYLMADHNRYFEAERQGLNADDLAARLVWAQGWLERHPVDMRALAEGMESDSGTALLEHLDALEADAALQRHIDDLATQEIDAEDRGDWDEVRRLRGLR